MSTSVELPLVLQCHWGPLCNHGARLVNERGERVLAGQLFRWLHHECSTLGVHADLNLLAKNARIAGCGSLRLDINSKSDHLYAQ